MTSKTLFKLSMLSAIAGLLTAGCGQGVKLPEAPYQAPPSGTLINWKDEGGSYQDVVVMGEDDWYILQNANQQPGSDGEFVMVFSGVSFTTCPVDDAEGRRGAVKHIWPLSKGNSSVSVSSSGAKYRYDVKDTFKKELAVGEVAGFIVREEIAYPDGQVSVSNLYYAPGYRQPLLETGPDGATMLEITQIQPNAQQVSVETKTRAAEVCNIGAL